MDDRGSGNSKLMAMLRRARSDRPEPLAERGIPTLLARALAEQPFESIGLLGGDIAATSDFDTTVEQLSAILECRLADVIVERKSMERQMQQQQQASSSASAHSATAPRPGVRRRAPADSVVESSSANIVLSPTCRAEIREYVRRIGGIYRDCRYHRFEHAAHVTCSANKLLDMMEERELSGAEEAHAQYGAYDGSPGCEPPDEPPACSYATGDPLVPTVHIDHPKLGEFVRRMSDLQKRRGSMDTASSSPRRRDSMLTSNTSVTEGEDQQQDEQWQFEMQQQQYLTRTPEPQPVPRMRFPQSFTFGIASDPLTKFAVLFAALVHDADHQGVPNKQLVAEVDELALLYNDKSVAEQHSLKVAFQTLMQPQFATFRHCLIPTSADQFQFRRLVIELVLCTDIASPERMQLTKSKWIEAFGEIRNDDGVATVTASRPNVDYSEQGRRAATPRRASIGVPGYAPSFYPAADSTVNGHGHHHRGVHGNGECLGIKRALHLNGSTIEFYAAPGDEPGADPRAAEERLRASVVLETVMNAADVAHTLQSWDNFLRWNRRLYEELYHAYRTGRIQRGEANPAADWYGNQLTFYNIYILPLARKLRRCGAFGVRGREFIRNAKAIRRRWQEEGAEVTRAMIEDVYEQWEARLRGDEVTAADIEGATGASGEDFFEATAMDTRHNGAMRTVSVAAEE